MDDQKKTIHIRRAKQPDIAAIFRLLEQSFTAGHLSFVELSEDRLMVWIAQTIAHHDVWVAELSGRVVGSIALVPYQFPWSHDALMSNCWCYVLKPFRRRGTGRMMVEAAKRSADEKGAALFINAQGVEGADWKDEFVAAEGFSYVGGIFYRPAMVSGL